MNTRLYVIAYDISSPQRLRRVACICEDYGIRLQQSVFECHLSPRSFQQMWDELLTVFNLQEDALVVYPVCEACRKGVQVMGNACQRIDLNEPFIF